MKLREFGSRQHASRSRFRPAPVTRSYFRFSQASYENAISRVYLGVHYWFDESAGMKVGSAIGSDIFHNVMTAKRT